MTDAANMIVLGATDNVGVALRDIVAGVQARDSGGRALPALEDIPQGHKIALRDIATGDRIIRLGIPVALATVPVGPGRLVHVHNVRSQYLDNDHDHYE